MIAALTPNAFIANLLNPPIMITFGLFSGVAIPRTLMPAFWGSWLNPLDPMAHLVNGMMSTELHQLQVVCSAPELAIFEPPGGQTCGQYAATFMETAIGYLANPNATSNCGYCPYSVGDGYLSYLEFSWSDRWQQLAIFGSFIVSNLIILGIAARYLNYAKR
jgi:ATP-binding cassette subfamily G (WHITE) protein 2 (SNQ2)